MVPNVAFAISSYVPSDIEQITQMAWSDLCATLFDLCELVIDLAAITYLSIAEWLVWFVTLYMKFKGLLVVWKQ